MTKGNIPFYKCYYHFLGNHLLTYHQSTTWDGIFKTCYKKFSLLN